MKLKLSYRAIAPLALALAAAAPARELKESFTVEGEYDIEVVPQERISTLPERVSFPLPAAVVNPDLTGLTVNYRPAYTAMPSLGWRDSRTVNSHRGYLDLSAGSWLNVAGSAGYRILDKENSSLGVMLQHNSTSLFKPDLSEETADVKRYRYDETLGLNATFRFPSAGILSADVYYNLALFNYYGVAAPAEQASRPDPTQTLNNLFVRGSWSSFNAPGRLNYSAGASARYFAYRAPGAWRSLSPKGSREGTYSLFGGVEFPWDSGSALGADLRGDVVNYSGIDVPDTYGNVELTPYYRFSNGNLLVHAGLELDFTFRAGTPGDRFSAFHAAPDVRLDWQGRGVALFLHATGGTRLSTLASMGGMDYYQSPVITETRPVYTPLDAELGISFGPLGGFMATLTAGYAISNNIRLDGWNMAALNRPGSIELPIAPQGYLLSLAPGNMMNLHGYRIALDARYEYAGLLKLEAGASYQHQNGKKGVFNGYDRPEWVVSASATVTPVSKLDITLAYDLRARRRIYAATESEPLGFGTLAGPAVSMQLPNFYDLTAGVAYRFTEEFSIFGQAANLLNRHTAVLPMQKPEGFNFLLGFGFKF